MFQVLDDEVGLLLETLENSARTVGSDRPWADILPKSEQQVTSVFLTPFVDCFWPETAVS